MSRDHVVRLERRRLLQGLGAVSLSVAGASLLAGCATQVAPFFASASGDKLETTNLRLFRSASLCHTPQLRGYLKTGMKAASPGEQEVQDGKQAAET